MTNRSKKMANGSKVVHQIEIQTRYLYPFDKMNVGDTFTYPASIAPLVRRAASWHKKRTGRCFKTKTGDELGECRRVR